MVLYFRLRTVERVTVYTQIIHDLEISKGMLNKELDALKREDITPSQIKGKSLRFYMQ